jgi:uroporphyrinogen III methyltransferase/synthase
VNPAVLRFARPGAELVCLGRHGKGRIVTQEEVHQRMIAAAREGRVVARLKGGDPAIFGRAAEEAAALEAADVPYEIVPGVTAAQAASSYAGVPLTHREAASCVALVTGRQCSDDDELDMAALARFPGTLVFYMGVTTAPHWTAELIASGKPADTPTAIVRRGSLPEQETILTTLAGVPQTIAERKLRPPAVIIVGESVHGAQHASWFTSRPLFGRTVLVTRPEHQADELAVRLADLGAQVLLQPAISIGDPHDWRSVDDAIGRIAEFDWLVFSSANGVHQFLSRLRHQGLDGRALGGVRLAAIGPATAAALAEHHLLTDLAPDEYRAEALAAALASDAAGQHILLIRASRGREVLAETLAAAGAEVTQAVAYESRDVTELDPEVAAALAEGRIDWITVTSSAIARSLVSLLGERLRSARLAAISPLTAGVLAEAGFEAAAVASDFTAEGLVAAILAAAR